LTLDDISQSLEARPIQRRIGKDSRREAWPITQGPPPRACACTIGILAAISAGGEAPI